MAGFDKDGVRKELGTSERAADRDSHEVHSSASRSSHSVSFSIPTHSMESYESETSLVGHTGPLRGERTPFVPMSGPLHVTRKPENRFKPHDNRGLKMVKPIAEKFASDFGNNDQNSWRNDRYPTKNERLLKSGMLGMCNDPYCTTCPTKDSFKAAQQKNSIALRVFDPKFHNALYGDAKGWARRFFSFLSRYIPGVMNPHSMFVQQLNKIFVISCLVAIFVDPMFFFLLYTQKDNKCIIIDLPMTKIVVFFRCMTDFMFLLHMLLQFRLAYVAPESKVIGAGELVDHPKKIALNYLRGHFLIDLCVVLPLPQIIILLVLPNSLRDYGANKAKNILRTAILVQYIPRLYRFLPVLAGQSPNGFVFESAWANFTINLLTFMLSGQVVGSCWYIFGVQRVNECLREACHKTAKNATAYNATVPWCMKFMDCGHGNYNEIFESYNKTLWNDWKHNSYADACFNEEEFTYGIYKQAVNLTAEGSMITRYTYSLFWGFQQISTLAGNQSPSYFLGEVFFTMVIIGLGLLLFALLIGNMQNFLQALGRRTLEMSLQRREIELWMGHRRLPEELRREVRQAERYNWAATRGVNEEKILDNLPENLQRDIRRSLFKFVKKVRILALMDDPVLDAIRERLRQKIYIRGSKILDHGGLVEKMVFIVRGKVESIGEDWVVVPLSEGDFCGEELLAWCLEHSSVNKDEKKHRIPGQKLLSNRIVRCVTNVEAFSLGAADLQEVTSHYARFLRNPQVQGAIRYESPYWRFLAAIRIQMAWRKKMSTHLDRTDTSGSNVSSG